MADRITYGPFTLYESDAYKAAKEIEAQAKLARLEKAKLDIEKAKEESLTGRVQRGEQFAMIEEKARQASEGVPIGQEVARQVTAPRGLSLLEGTKAQSDIELQQAMEQGRLGAIRQYGVERGIVPSAKVDVGGITQTVPSGMAATSRADLQSRAYAASWPKLSELYQDQGYSKEDADRLAKENASGELIKGSNSGKISLTLGDVMNPTVVSVPWEIGRAHV